MLQNSDGTVALRCTDTGLFLDQTPPSFYRLSNTCTKPGICPTCKFLLEVGSIVPIHLEILDIRCSPLFYFLLPTINT